MKAIAAILFVCAAIFAGCTTEEVLIQDLDVRAPVQSPPLHAVWTDKPGAISFSGGIRAYPGRSILGRIDGHSDVSLDGSVRVDTFDQGGSPQYQVSRSKNPYPFLGNNLNWNFPDASAFFSGAVNLSEHQFIRIGGQYAKAGGRDNLGGFAALGSFRHDEDIAYTFEAGYAFSKSRYHLQYMSYISQVFYPANEQDYNSVRFGEVDGESRFTNFFLAITMNSYHSEAPITGMVRLSVDRQGMVELATHSNSAIATVTHTALLWSITPAIIYSLGGDWRLTVGAQLAYDGYIRDGDQFLPVMPVVGVQFQ